MKGTTNATRRNAILRLFRANGGWLRQTDLRAAGYHARWLTRLVGEGAVERARKGLYRLPDGPAHSNQSLLDAGRAVPEGVVCLLSALAFYELTTANPPEVYLAIGRKAWVPRVVHPPIRFFRFSQPMLALGTRELRVPGGTIRIFDEEKTLCDCLRHRSVVGQDVAVEALRSYLARRKKNIERLVRISRACRVGRRLGAYLEALL